MLFKELDKLKRSAVMSTIVLAFFGFVMLLLPQEYISFLSDALAFCLLVALGVSILYFLSSSKALIHYIALGAGLLCGAVGIALYVFEKLLFSSLTWLVGVIPILAGAYGVLHALLFARRSGKKGWWVLIVLSALLILFGGLVFFNPWMEDKQALMKIIGGTLMFSALLSGLRVIWIWPLKTQGE